MKLLCRDLFDETDSIDSAAVAPPSRTARGGKSAYKLNSVGARFRKQLHGLMGTLNQCQPHYIRSVSQTCCLLWCACRLVWSIACPQSGLTHHNLGWKFMCYAESSPHLPYEPPSRNAELPRLADGISTMLTVQ